MKEKLRKSISGKLESYSRQNYVAETLSKEYNTWVVLLVRYSGLFLKWTREELKQMDQRTRKVMTMHKALYSRDDVDRLYVSIKEGRKGLTSIEDSVDASMQKLEDYKEKRGERLVTVIRNNTDNTKTSRTTRTRKNTMNVLNG